MPGDRGAPASPFQETDVKVADSGHLLLLNGQPMAGSGHRPTVSDQGEGERVNGHSNSGAPGSPPARVNSASPFTCHHACSEAVQRVERRGLREEGATRGACRRLSTEGHEEITVRVRSRKVRTSTKEGEVRMTCGDSACSWSREGFRGPLVLCLRV